MNTRLKQYRETWLPADRTNRRRGLLIALILATVLVATVIFAIAGMQQSLFVRGEVAPSESELAVADSEPAEESTGSAIINNDDPMVSNLAPELRQALEAAAHDAAGSDVYFEVNSGWRTVEEQERLFAEAVDQYGSEAEAARWVAPPTSMHVQGKAVDISPLTATDWLAQFGSDYGLCQTYSNELWHYEFVADAVEQGCPVAYADASEDPRLY